MGVILSCLYIGERSGTITNMPCCRVAVSSLLALFVVLEVGCRAGHLREQSRSALGVSSGEAPSEHRFENLSAVDLRHALVESRMGSSSVDGGRVLYKAVEVQGGWDHWKTIGAVAYRRVRTIHKEMGDDTAVKAIAAQVDRNEAAASRSKATGAMKAPVESDEAQFSWVASRWRSEAGQERWLFALPFALATPEYAREFLGVEVDLEEEARFEKVKFFRLIPQDDSGLGPARVVLGYFNLESGLLTRVQFKSDTARWVEIRFSGWQNVAGLRMATRRQFYVFDSEFRYVHDEDLVWTDVLSDFKTDTSLETARSSDA